VRAISAISAPLAEPEPKAATETSPSAASIKPVSDGRAILFSRHLFTRNDLFTRNGFSGALR
jgi:hypothetical protein